MSPEVSPVGGGRSCNLGGSSSSNSCSDGMAAAAAGPATAQRFLPSFSDALVDEDPQAALEELTEALEEKPDDAQNYCQRAYCHILLGNYCGNFSYKIYFL